LRIDYRFLQPADILEYKRGKGFCVSGVLGRLLQIVDRKYDGWGWHVSIAWVRTTKGWFILEATSRGVQLNHYTFEYLERTTRAYRWFDEPPDRQEMTDFALAHLGKPYDVAVYFWTGIAILLRRAGVRLPKLIDRRYTCWELVQEFSFEMDDPIIPREDVIIISDLIKSLEAR
jgi:hypothetical protein